MSVVLGVFSASLPPGNIAKISTAPLIHVGVVSIAQLVEVTDSAVQGGVVEVLSSIPAVGHKNIFQHFPYMFEVHLYINQNDIYMFEVHLYINQNDIYICLRFIYISFRFFYISFC